MSPGEKQGGSAVHESEIAGSTQRWSFDSGPTAGKTYEHTFREDGTVSFREVKQGEKPAREQGGDGKGDRPRYGEARIADGIVAVSYLSSSGYTLTVILNEHGHTLHGFASNDKEWYPVHGSFEHVG